MLTSANYWSFGSRNTPSGNSGVISNPTLSMFSLTYEQPIRVPRLHEQRLHRPWIDLKILRCPLHNQVLVDDGLLHRELGQVQLVDVATLGA